MSAYLSTDVVVVFEDSAAPTLTSAQTVVAVTESGPAPSRLADSSPIHAHTIHTPLQPQLFARFLNTHPNKAFASKLLLSLRFGFRIGYNGPHSPLTAPNLRSALEHPDVVDEALRKEVAENRIAGPYSYPPYQNLRCSGLGVVPKSDGSWRLIYHISAPIGNSINDIIEYLLQYSTIDDAITICHSLGPGALMSKVDLKSAFRLCPVHPDDWQLLGIHWQGRYYIDKCLPFGLRSAPYLFNMVTDTIQWILHCHFQVSNSFHYLDDFSSLGQPTPRPVTLQFQTCSCFAMHYKPR